MITYIREHFDYNYWRNQKILAKAAQIQPWQIEAPTTFPFVSLRGTLVHTLAAEVLWFQRLHNYESPTALLTKDEFPTLQSIVQRWAQVEADWRKWLNKLTAADLAAERTYQLLGGGRPSVTDKLVNCLLHVVNHGTQHCAEMAQMLTNYGQSPGNIDLIYYIRDKKK
jgi:uncharacterized damage-inducible protein DinB